MYKEKWSNINDYWIIAGFESKLLQEFIKKETLTDDQRQQYTVVSQALKVILNASYGVMGAEIFPLYFLPAAEATTAIGRHTILETIKKCEETGVEVSVWRYRFIIY